jgi:16S rRNA (cytidine1402-2'-O)-methyltransferase
MTTKKKGTLYLIPVPLAPDALHTLSSQIIEVLHATQHFVVENARTSRRFIKSTNPPYPIDSLVITELDKHDLTDARKHLEPLFDGRHVGVLSEAGCPGIADPGSVLVRFAHAHQVRVVPLTGPSSILLALMASGMNGQQFHFHGYLSAKKGQLNNDLKRLEDLVRKDRATQIFIEAPYRNTQVFEIALQVLSDETALCLAIDLTAGTEWIRTMKIGAWKKYAVPELHKRPAVFLIGDVS